MRESKNCTKKLGNLLLLLVCLWLAPTVAEAQRKTVTGVVTEQETAAPIANATVLVKGTSRGTTTNAEGHYTIAATSDETLIFSAVGYKAVEQKVGGQSSINVLLESEGRQEDEVVVTALGIKREEKALGYSVSVVKGEQLTDAVSGNWTDALSGKVAGLNLVRSGSGPTGSNKIILRGENNLTGDNEALIVVDGVIISGGSGRRTSVGGETTYATGSENLPADYGSGLNDINPEDIESVSVLKGPGAAALYGARAANGAIIITTKSGSKKGKGWGVTLNSNYSTESVNRWPDLQYEYGQGTGGVNYYSFGASPMGASTSSTSSAYGPKFDGQYFFQYNPIRHGQDSIPTLWQPYKNQTRDYFETGHTFTNSVTVEGGSDKTSARFSYTNVDNSWILPNTGYKRHTVAMSVNTKISDKLQIASKVNYTNKFSDNLPSAGYGNQSIMYWYIFWQPNADLNWLKEYWRPGQEQRGIFYPFSSFPENPYAVAYEFLNASNRNGVTGNLQATYNFSEELSLMVRTSLDFGYEQRSQRRPFDAGSRFPKGSYRTQNIYSQEATTDFLLRYVKKISPDFDFSITAGGSRLTNNYNKDEVRADSLIYPGIYSMSNAAGTLVSIPWKSKYQVNSLYGLLTAAYKNFLFADATFRQDWTSTLATPQRSDNAGFFYPSLNLSFVASDLWQMPKSVDFAKLRFSVAGVGSGGTTPYLTAYNYEPAGNLYNGGLVNPSILANPDLRPLRTITYELGVAAKMFKSRFGVDFAIYSGSTKDQILSRVIDWASGYGRSVINAGTVKNTGLELSLNGTPVKTASDFQWNTSVIFSANKNRILSMPDSSVVLQNGPVGGGQIVAKTGGSMGDLWGRGYVRAPDGQVIYDPLTGYAKLSQEVVFLGNTIPKGKISFGNEFKYKQFRLNLLFDAQYGAVAHSLSHYKLAEQGKLKSTIPGRYNGIIGNGVLEVLDGSGNVTGYRPNDVIATDIDQYYRSHWGIDNAEGSTFSTDFIKFREARLDYSLPASIIKRLGLQRATIGVYGRDLFIWSSWPIFDPEFGTLSGTDIVRGFETAQFPSTRTIGANLIIGL